MKTLNYVHFAQIKKVELNSPAPQQPSMLAQPANQPAPLQLRMDYSLWPRHSTYCNISIGTENGIDREGNLETQNGLE